jgi:isopentenyldiphosphate isomerase
MYSVTTARPTEAQDPNELFDVVRVDGSPLGIAKARSLVHRDGDWHRAVHIWITGMDEAGAPFLIMQRRGFEKDTWPGRLDATVGGHYRAGEELAETLREAEEELGVPVELEELRWLGVRACVNEGEPNILDHELQDVFLWRDDRPLHRYLPNPAELAGLVSIPIDGLLSLLRGDLQIIPALFMGTSGPAALPVELTIDDLIPNVDRYVYRVAIAAKMALRGEPDIAI